MKTIKILLLIILCGTGHATFAQEVPSEMAAAIKADDATELAALVTKDNVNDCYGDYSLLSHAVRLNARKCFDLLLEKGADVNKICNGYVPPIMHAAKYGRLDMVKILVAKGANINYSYHGTWKAIDGQSPLTYAEMYKHQDIAEYLKSVKK